jgi:hypothetical protein
MTRFFRLLIGLACPRQWHLDWALWPLGASLPRRGRGQHVRHAIRTPVERQRRRRHRALDRPRRDLRIRVVYEAAQLAFRQALLLGEDGERSSGCRRSQERPRDYAVVWRTGNGPTSSGRLELGDDDLVLHGSGGPEGLRIPFDDLSSVEIGRGTAELSASARSSSSSKATAPPRRSTRSRAAHEC